MPRWVRIMVLLLATSLILVVSLWPHGDPVTLGLDVSDKLRHAAAFWALTLLSLWTFPRRIFLALLALIAFGGLIELLQGALGWRTAHWPDFVADAAGIAVGLVVYQTLRKLVGGTTGLRSAPVVDQ